ncbi:MULTISPECIES: rhodanese-like domain-containing protein [unclassified Haladaptatus]|uniref:rhodanese-like domain-containing protein n=1 Tax=unclassified Haladaptatus TaxID=2622732 RepID=UPI0023E86638|nr:MULTISPECIES: rhodanese-like domain-containing protein [unclassified Haladaptatus]
MTDLSDDEIAPDEVKSLLDEGADVRVVDIRSPGAFAREHIPGSENIPFHSLVSKIPTLADADHIVTVCPHGISSVQAARLIASYEGTAHASVESMAGGLDAWKYDIVSGNETDSAQANEGPDSPF